MAFRAVFSEPGPNPEGIPPCPICRGKMEVVYDRYHHKVVVCGDCHAGLTIPPGAWQVARVKRAGVDVFRQAGVQRPK